MPKKKLNVLLFVPGMLFWVLVAAGAATRNDTLIGAAVAIAVVTIVTSITLKVRASGIEKAHRQRVLATGHPGRAKVVAISTRGGGTGDNPLVRLELDVQVEGRPNYRVTAEEIISVLAIPRIQPACEIAVHVDRDDAQHVVVDPALTPYGPR